MGDRNNDFTLWNACEEHMMQYIALSIFAVQIPLIVHCRGFQKQYDNFIAHVNMFFGVRNK